MSSLQSSGFLAPLPSLIAAASPWSPIPSELFCHFSSPSAPWSPLPTALSLSVIVMVPLEKPSTWLLPATPPWAVILAGLWIPGWLLLLTTLPCHLWFLPGICHHLLHPGSSLLPVSYPSPALHLPPVPPQSFYGERPCLPEGGCLVKVMFSSVSFGFSFMYF